jgi:hypothetical protein
VWGSTTSPSGGYVPDPLAQFLSRVVPWSTTQPPDGFVNIHAFGGTNPLPYRGGGRAYASLAEWGELTNFVGYLNRIDAEVFFCLSLQGKILGVKNGHRRADRHARDVVRLRSFVLDLDVKPTGYPSQRAALAALLTFCADLGLELGYVVDSGSGIHAYFTLDQPITHDRWVPLSSQLRAAATAKGLKFDAKVTANGATLLRLPTSFNRKDAANPKPCRVLQQGVVTTLDKFTDSLSEFPATQTVVTPGVSPQKFTLDPVIFPRRAPITGAYVDHVRQQIEQARVVTDATHLHRACPVFADSYDRGGDGDAEPLWFSLAKLCHYVEDGRNLFHDLSSDDGRYDEEAVDQKFDSVQIEGWPSCQTFEGSSLEAAKICRSCQFYGQGKSPINFARLALVGTLGSSVPTTTPYVNGTASTPPVIAFGTGPTHTPIMIPQGFTHGPDFIIRKAGEPVFVVPVYELDLVSSHTGDSDTYEDYVKAVISRGVAFADRNEFRFSGKVLARSQTIADVAFQYGMTFRDPLVAREFFMDWLTVVKNQRKSSSQNRVGWVATDNDPFSGFTYGGWTSTRNGRVPSGIPKEMQQDYSPRGTLSGWLKPASALLGRGFVEHEVLIASAFAAPLIAFTPEDGAVLFGYSTQSGVGKSAAIDVAASVWGLRGSVVRTYTDNSMFDTMASLNNLPPFFDELVPGQQSQKKFNEIVMTVTGGKEKSRLDRSAQRKASRRWKTLLVAAANYSLVEAASSSESNAQAVRVFEFEIPPRFNTTAMRSDIAKIHAELDQNCGQAGLVYADFIGRNAESVKQLVYETMDEFQRQLHSRDDERFWLSVAAAVMVGAQISNGLKLLHFDLQGMWKFLANTIRKQRDMVQNMGVNVDDPMTHVNRLAQFLNEHVRNQIHTDTLPTQGANRHTRQQVHNIVQLEHSNFFVARRGNNDQLLNISRDRLKGWCKKENYNYRQMIKVLAAAQLCTLPINKKSLGAQAVMSNPPAAEYVLEFDLSKPELQGF